MTDRCAIERKSYGPGMHGQRRTKLSEFGMQLREKQKVRRNYGMLEKQFRSAFEQSAKRRGVTSELFFRGLELRLDNVVYRMGFARSRREARQIVSHNHILLNGKRTNIPSLSCKAGDTIAVSPKSQKMPTFSLASELHGKRAQVPWVEVDHGKYEGKVTALPHRDDIQLPVKERLIVELYSK